MRCFDSVPDPYSLFMKAIRVENFGDSRVMQLQEIAAPVAGSKQVLIRLHAAGVNPVDTYIRTGNHAHKPTLPYTPGFDGAGEVIALGADWPRADIKVGSRVWCCRSVTGTYAEQCVCDAKSVALLPDHVSYEAGAGVGTASMTAWLALVPKAGATDSDIVLVHGASGGVGLSAVQFAKAMGCTVIGTAGTDKGLHEVIMHGADYAVNHRENGYESKIIGLTDQKGPDVILEMLANVNLSRDMQMIGQRGRIVVIGNRGEITVNPRMLMTKDASVIGMSMMNAKDVEWALALRAVRDGLANNTLKPLIHHKMPLAEAGRAHDLVMDPSSAGGGALGKIILTMN